MGRGAKRALAVVAALVGLTTAAHVAVVEGTRITPPAIARVDLPAPVEAGGITRIGGSYTRLVNGIHEVHLEGSPEQIGATHVRLLLPRMIADEDAMWSDFARFVRFAPARALLMDLGRARYAHVDRGFPEARKRELAAQAMGFDPDPFTDRLPTYQRLVFLHALYDIALGFEHSPLIGCSSFVLGPGATKDGHTLLARAFDFEAGDQWDRDKAVFFVREDGAIPFASVAWPGLIGVMSGMNAEGVAIVVHGGRAKEPRAEGEPVVFMMRDVLERAHDADEAVAILRAQRVMVSHLVLVADAKGKSAVVERAPDVEAFVRPNADPDRVALTNHFEGPLASDPKNEAVKAHTTTLARRARLDEMLAGVEPMTADVERAVAMLRDHQCARGDDGGSARSAGRSTPDDCPLGDRRAIDALIATHGIVADTTDRVLWVSAGPHLSGAFVRFDLKALLAPDHDPSHDPPPQTIPADPILDDGRYAAGRAHAGGPRFGGDAP